MKIKVLLIILFLISAISFPQIINNYQETNKRVSFQIKLNTVAFSIRSDENGKTVEFKNYIDESDPGGFALPSKEIIIALPSFSKVSVDFFVSNINRIEGKPTVNPDIELKEDGTVSYKKVKSNLNSSLHKNPVEIKGYLWVKGYYCVHLKINQYQYNNDIIEEISEGNLSVNIINPDNNSKIQKLESENDTDYLASIIINYSNAVSLNKRIYEPLVSNYDWIDFTKTYVKIGTKYDGIYRIRKADLESFQINTSQINSSTFKLFLRGTEIPVRVKDDGNNVLDDNGFIEFVGLRNMGGNYRETNGRGEVYKEYLDRYSDTTVYWLTWGGSNGLRTDSVSIYSGLPQDTLLYYSEIFHFEENYYLDYSIDNLTRRQLPQWKENQTWVRGQQGVGTINWLFNAANIFPNKTAKAFYKIQDYSSDISVLVNTHKVGISINSDPTVYDTLFFNKYEQRVVKAEFNSNILTEGSNTLKTISYPTQTPLNTVAVDWYEVEYPRYINAVNDSLKFTINDLTNRALKYFKVINFNAQTPVIYKIKGGYKRITNFTRNGSEIVFADSVSAGDQYIITDQNKITSPVFFYKKNFTNLADAGNKADYILITHPIFLSKASEYTTFIQQTYNVSTKIINVFDIYDQFNFGFFSPEPIRDFLKTAYNNWQSPKPQYLFILGDANYDYYSNKAKYFNSPKVANLVPSFGEPVSDSWFVIWDSTGSLVPQMYVGRVPAGSIAEADHFINKHKNYISDPFDDWNKYYLFFSSGKGDDINELNLLKRTNDSIISKVVLPAPISGIAHHLYKTYQPRTNFGPYTPEEISAMIALGGVFTCYIGHSGTQVWDNGINDVTQLHNTRNKNSLISDFGCSTGKFAEPDIKAFGELFVNGIDGEAIGYTGNSSLGYLTNLPELFYSKMLKENILEIGKAHTMAKMNLINTYGNNTVNQVLMYCNLLFSDPIIKLKVPTKPNLVIAPKDVTLEKDFLDDSIDSVGIKVSYFNFGTNLSSSFGIEVKHLINGVEKETFLFTKKLPGFTDSIYFLVPVKGFVGNHSLVINLDNRNEINEIYKTDNNVTYNFNVASNAARLLEIELINNLSNGQFRIVNPVSRSLSDSLVYELSQNLEFISPQIFYKSLDTVYTKINLKNIVQGKRYWLRTKMNSTNSEYSTTYSFIFDSTAQSNFYIADTTSYKTLTTEGLDVSSVGIKLTRSNKTLRVISGGTNDGSFAVIEVDGNNYLPEGHLDGIHVAVFKDSTMEFLGSGRYSYWDHGSNFIPMLNTFLDTVSATRIVGFAFSGAAGIGLPDSIKAKIRNFGSIYIDSVKVSHSWALIGKKGSIGGSVPEKWNRPFSGSVSVDTVFLINQKNGFISTTDFGPVKKWNLLHSDYTIFAGSNITFQPIGTKQDGTKDTLHVLNFQNGKADISSLNIYDKVKFLIKFSRVNNSEPILNNIRIDYDPLNELGTNYQVFSIERDTVLIGENINLSFKVFNISNSSADSFKVRVDKIKPDNTRELIKEEIVPVIQPGTSISYNVTYNTSPASGNASIAVTIDPENKVKEFFRDNNVYIIPFYVKPDTTHPVLHLTFDGNEISDGDFISSDPVIKIELNDPSLLPITDTSSIRIRLDEVPVYFLNNPNIKFTFSSNNPKVIVEYKPKLTDGEHIINILGKNQSGALSDSMGIERTFVVNHEAKLLDVVNYPNPFKESTWFTFKLTQIPDEIRIRIFTIAGRLIKEINRKGNELKYDFNKIYWDGKDEDGDNIGNGVYLYKLIMQKGDKSESVIEKIAVIK